MRKAACIIWLMAFLLAVSTAVVWAQDKKPEAQKQEAVVPQPDAKEKADFSKKVDVFYQVVSVGEAQKDPLILLGAVRLLDELPFDGVVKDAVKAGEDAKSAPRYDRLALLKQAKEWATGDTELLAVIAKLEEPPEKTEVRGHGHHGGHYGHHHGDYYDYYYRPVHYRHYTCTWFYLCGYGGCEWICR